MSNKFTKVAPKIGIAINTARNFGIGFGMWELMDECLLRGHGRIGKRVTYWRYEYIKKWLKEKYFQDICPYFGKNEDSSYAFITEDCPIWIFWWQGLEFAPEVVRASIQSVRKHAQKHPVIVITEKNVEKYAKIPKVIYDKLNSGNITLTHFSDVLRVQLLYQWGGIWLDSTVYMTDFFDRQIYQKSFYTIHHNQRSDYHVCKGKWTSFCMASGKGNPIFAFLSNAFYTYLKQENYLICYLLIDCFLALGYENIEKMRQLVDDVPVNNTDIFLMASKYNESYTNELVSDICKETYLHKLSYKLKVKNKEDSLYYYIINNDI